MIEIKVKKLKSVKDMTIGLIGEKRAHNVYFETRFGIHTFFMNFDIDILVLDKRNRVVVLRKGLKPFRIFMWNIKYFKVLELPMGTIEKNNLELGDEVRIVNV